MKKLQWLTVVAFLLVACGSPEEPRQPATEATVDSPESHSSLAQLMRGLLYPNSEIIFATQDEDPEAAAAAGAEADPFGGGNLYAGWEGVENAALMLSEAANLIVIPGRLCENGLPVPLGNEDFRMAARQLVEAGRVAYEAALTKSMDAMLEASGVVSDACSVCHETYRDRSDDEMMRCISGQP
jgi:hypothetical protein